MAKVSLDKSSKEELSEIVRSFPVLYNKSRKGFKEVHAVKNAWNEATTALYFNLTVIFILTLLLYFLKLSYSSVSVFHFADSAVCRCSWRSSWKFRNFHRKTPVLESLFNNAEAHMHPTLLKRDSNTSVFLWI